MTGPGDDVAVADDLERRLERHRVELTAYCYRMLGSAFEAEDAVQETLTRAWRHHDRFEGRSSLRTWLYRIATNVCFDFTRAGQRRASPVDLEPPSSADGPVGPPLPERTWILPVPDELVVAPVGDPADRAVARESIRLAFVAALQLLPPRQRAVLILREVLRWEATEVAALLETTVASVTSALQRARATVASAGVDDGDVDAGAMDDEHRALLARYVDAIERYDIAALVALLRDDATLTMPPHAFWLRGATELGRWWGMPGPSACRGSALVPLQANGMPAFGQYRPSGPGGRHEPFALQVLELHGGRIATLHFYLDTDLLFPLFGLPAHLDR